MAFQKYDQFGLGRTNTIFKKPTPLGVQALHLREQRSNSQLPVV